MHIWQFQRLNKNTIFKKEHSLSSALFKLLVYFDLLILYLYFFSEPTWSAQWQDSAEDILRHVQSETDEGEWEHPQFFLKCFSQRSLPNSSSLDLMSMVV